MDEYARAKLAKLNLNAILLTESRKKAKFLDTT